MIDLESRVNGIRFDRERQFALAFFEHDKWVHEPRYFYLSDGTKYLPDFYDAKRDIYIEVVGSRQAYHLNKDKYVTFCNEYENIQLEFRLPSGEKLELRNGRMARPVVKKFKESRHYLKNINGAPILQEIVSSRNLSIAKVSKLCGISYTTVSAHYYGFVKSMKHEFAVKYATGLGLGMEELFIEKEAA
jgi:hypothetical protein